MGSWDENCGLSACYIFFQKGMGKNKLNKASETATHEKSPHKHDIACWGRMYAQLQLDLFAPYCDAISRAPNEQPICFLQPASAKWEIHGWSPNERKQLGGLDYNRIADYCGPNGLWLKGRENKVYYEWLTK